MYFFNFKLHYQKIPLCLKKHAKFSDRARKLTYPAFFEVK